jgi:hypothetical protein
MNPGPPGPHVSERPPPHRPEPTLVRDLDLREPLPGIEAAEVTRVLLLVRVGAVAVGTLLLPVPEEGLTGADLGAAIAGRVGARRRIPRRNDQARSRNRGRMSSA